MQFNRSALVAAIDKAIEQEQAAIDGARQRNEEAREAQRQEWLSLHHDSWQKAANAIKAKLRRGEPVTEDDIPRDRAGYSGKAYFRPRGGEQVTVRAVELKGLRAVLDAISDQEISSTGLRSLGVGVNTLRMIVPLLGTASVRAETLKVMR